MASGLYIQIIFSQCFPGFKAQTTVHQLVDKDREVFQRASTDVFVLSSNQSLGDITCARLWHDNEEGDWYLRLVFNHIPRIS